MPYRVVILHAAWDQLRGAPPLPLGYVDGILAVLRKELQIVAVTHVTWIS